MDINDRPEISREQNEKRRIFIISDIVRFSSYFFLFFKNDRYEIERDVLIE